MNGFTRACLAMALVIAAATARADVEVIALRHRSVDQVIPVLRPLLEQAGAISGMNNQLVIRASRSNIAELRRVLEAIDRPPRRLMIHVRQDSAAAQQDRGAGISIAIGSARDGSGGETNARGYVIDSRAAAEDRLAQQVQTIEGTPALIHVGQSIPVVERATGRTPAGGLIVSESTRYRDVTSGFEVTARVIGDRVTLEIRPRRESAGSDGAISLQRIESTAGGRLGEWFELGGIAQDESARTTGLVAGTVALRQDNRRVWVKVEEIR